MRRATWIRVATLAALAAAIAAIFLFVPAHEYWMSILDWLERAGPMGMVALGALYVPASLLFLPAWPLTVGAGFLFHIVRGTITVSMGSVLGASAAFFAGRTLVRGFIEERIARNPKFAAIDHAVAEHGFKIVLLVRLSPVLPFNLLNYAFGLTKVSFRDYFFGSWIGMLPGTIMYVYLGSAAKDLASLVADDLNQSPVQKVLLLAGLFATVAVTVLLARIAKRALDRAIVESTGPDPADASHAKCEPGRS